MGQEEEHERRLRDLAPFRLDEEKLAQAGSDAVAMHCLPAHVGEEITENVLYGDRSSSGTRRRTACTSTRLSSP